MTVSKAHPSNIVMTLRSSSIANVVYISGVSGPIWMFLGFLLLAKLGLVGSVTAEVTLALCLIANLACILSARAPIHLKTILTALVVVSVEVVAHLPILFVQLGFLWIPLESATLCLGGLVLADLPLPQKAFRGVCACILIPAQCVAIVITIALVNGLEGIQ